MTSPLTSSLSSDVAFGLFDELTKISEATSHDPTPSKVRQHVKNALLVAGGVAAGTGAAMVAEKALQMSLGPQWAAMSPSMKKAILVPAIGASSIGAYIAAQKLSEERSKRR